MQMTDYKVLAPSIILLQKCEGWGSLRAQGKTTNKLSYPHLGFSCMAVLSSEPHLHNL